MKNRKPGQVPLERALSKLGICSRTQAKDWIEAGRIRIDGVVRKNPFHLVVPERIRIELDGKLLENAERITLALYKPKGLVTTHSDEKGRATIFSLLPDNTRHLNTVGRLDAATTGLLILTSDSRLSSWLTDPKNEVPRVYLVSVRGEVLTEKLEKMRKGVLDEGDHLRADRIEIQKSSGRESHLIVHLKEGKNREIRRLFLAFGHEVTRLKRVSYGGLELGDLKPGESREVSDPELAEAFPGAPIRVAAG